MPSSITNFPNGVSSFGAPAFPDDSPGGYAVVRFVGGTAAGYSTSAAGTSYENPAPTLLSMLASGVCDPSDRGTLIVVRKGHTENISAADYFSAQGARKRIKIVGEGEGIERPTFTWTTAGSTWLLDTDSIILKNLVLNMEPGTGTVTVAAPITISGAGCRIINCDGRMGTDANNKVTIGITTTAAADDLVIAGCNFYSAAAAECTTMIQLVGADRLRFLSNTIRGATSSVAVGVIRFLTTASTDIQMYDNVLEHKKAASETALLGMAGITGQIDYLHLNVLANAAGQLVIGGANSAFLLPGSVQCGANVFVTNTTAETAAKMTPVSA